MHVRFLFFLGLLPLPLAAQAASGVDTQAMNTSVEPCVDFYQYACGNWIVQNPLPADRPRWARFTELSDRTEQVLLDLVQSAAVAEAPRGSIDQKIGDYYSSCMDTGAIDKKWMSPVRPELDRIQDLHNQSGLAAEVAHLHRLGIGALFRLTSEPDPKDSAHMIAALAQGGLSLPDRDYYLKTDAKSVETRQRYEQHVQKMFELSGDLPETAATRARAVLELETLLAKSQLDRVSRRDPEKTYHPMTRAELSGLAPAFAWNQYFKEVGAPAFDTIDVEWPDFVQALPLEEPLDTWKAYFTYHILHATASELPDVFENEDFNFWGRYLGGAHEQRPRGNRCVNLVDANLGDLLGQKYVEARFGPAAKARIGEIVKSLEKALNEDIQTLDWMTPQTKAAAIRKLEAITNNIGYPQKWRDYSKVTITRDDFYGNTRRAAAAAYERRLARIGKPTDKSEWTMTTPTVNAFYSPDFNSINFPAGILQPPFFDPNRDPAANYGAIGAVIGHEMTHGFDDQGRKFDGDGNLKDWWTPQDAQAFEKRAACLRDEYSNFTAIGNLKVNGGLTLGENTADNGGVRIALMALMDSLGGKEDRIDGLTPQQRFFVAYAQVWCENSSPEAARLQALTNPHSPGRYRVDGVIRNMPEFQKAFACKANQPMVSEHACRVW